MSVHPVLIRGQWCAADSTESFHAANPATGQVLPDEFPVSQWSDLDAALSDAARAAPLMRILAPERLAEFFTHYAARIEARAADLVESAHAETALSKAPRLLTIELPRTITQLRQAAAAALDRTWSLPTIDTKNNIRSHHAPLGPVLVIGPNNFPFAFNAVAGGDFAAALAAGNPVIAKAHPSHPNTTRLLAQEAALALESSGLPRAAIQMLYHIPPDCGLRAAADPRLAAIAFTGSRRAGLALKAAADAAGKPIYLEMSSLNPVVILPGALRERPAKIADEFADSALAASGQFCTNPGLTLLLDTPETHAFIAAVTERFHARKPAPLLSFQVQKSLAHGVQTLLDAGAQLLTGGTPIAPCAFANTLLRVSADQFLSHPQALQTEAFGNASLLVIARDAGQLAEILDSLEGNLTGCIYSAADGPDEAAGGGGDDALYSRLVPHLRPRVGRLLNDKMPTGVALSPAMNHGGPFPSTGHPGFTSVGIPTALRRFTQLESYDNVRPQRLPPILRNQNPDGGTWRLIDGTWSRANLPT